MCLDKELTYPLYISVNMQIVTPFSISNEEDKDKISTIVPLQDG